MYAIIAFTGKQFKVAEGEVLRVDRQEDKKEGEEIVFDKVLMVRTDKDTLVGTPTVSGATVTGTVTKQTRGPRIIVFKKRSKKTYRKTMGHRQDQTLIKVNKISVKG